MSNYFRDIASQYYSLHTEETVLILFYIADMFHMLAFFRVAGTTDIPGGFALNFQLPLKRLNEKSRSHY